MTFADECQSVSQNLPIISSGAEHVIALSYDKKLYAWGSNSTGQLGILNSPNMNKITLPPGKEILTIATGGYFSTVLTIDSATTYYEIYSWGQNNFGQLGNGNLNDMATP